MPANSDDQPLDHPKKSPSENFPKEITPAIDADGINPIQETENRESPTQELHKVPGQKWKHYFFEFLMVFLAVFAGFLAENQRENIGERQREKKFARRLLSDLRQDSIFFEGRVKLLEERQKAHKQFLQLMTSPTPAADWEVMREFVPLLTGTNNDFTTATYEQMKTSGSLRYIDNDHLTTSLQKYYDVFLVKASRDSDGADKFFIDFIIPYMTKHFRFQDFKPSDGTSRETRLLNRSAESDQELINIMGVWASNCDTQLDLLRPAQKEMLGLVHMIKKEYDLE